jgi:hypothetical protein
MNPGRTAFRRIAQALLAWPARAQQQATTPRNSAPTERKSQ